MFPDTQCHLPDTHGRPRSTTMSSRPFETTLPHSALCSSMIMALPQCHHSCPLSLNVQYFDITLAIRFLFGIPLPLNRPHYMMSLQLLFSCFNIYSLRRCLAAAVAVAGAGSEWPTREMGCLCDQPVRACVSQWHHSYGLPWWMEPLACWFCCGGIVAWPLCSCVRRTRLPRHQRGPWPVSGHPRKSTHPDALLHRTPWRPRLLPRWSDVDLRRTGVSGTIGGASHASVILIPS